MFFLKTISVMRNISDLQMKIADLTSEIKSIKTDLMMLENKIYKKLKTVKKEDPEDSPDIDLEEIKEAFDGNIPIELIQKYKSQ